MKSLSAMMAAAAALCFVGGAWAQEKTVMIGGQCDRTGPTQIVGVVVCPAIQDYIDLVNSKGGVEGYKIKYNELDNEYKVPQAVEEYERQKQEGAVSMAIYGTPQVQALNQKLVEDKIPGTSPGFGISASADGSRFRTCSRSRPPTGRKPPRRSSSSRTGLAAASKARRLPMSITTTLPDTSRCRSSKICRRPRGSRCGPSPFRRRVWKWARRCSTSRSAIARTL